MSDSGVTGSSRVISPSLMSMSTSAAGGAVIFCNIGLVTWVGALKDNVGFYVFAAFLFHAKGQELAPGPAYNPVVEGFPQVVEPSLLEVLLHNTEHGSEGFRLLQSRISIESDQRLPKQGGVPKEELRNTIGIVTNDLEKHLAFGEHGNRTLSTVPTMGLQLVDIGGDFINCGGRMTRRDLKIKVYISPCFFRVPGYHPNAQFSTESPRGPARVQVGFI